MPKKASNVRNVKKMTAPMSPENKKLYDNRVFRFNEIIGGAVSKKEFQKVIDSDIDYWDMQNLIENGCSPELAIKILI